MAACVDINSHVGRLGGEERRLSRHDCVLSIPPQQKCLKLACFRESVATATAGNYGWCYGDCYGYGWCYGWDYGYGWCYGDCYGYGYGYR